MDKNIVIKLLALLSLLSLLACGSGTGDSGDGGAGASAPKLIDVDPAPNDISVLVGSAITVTFNTDMHSGTDSTFVVYGSQTGKVAGIYAGGGSDMLRFDPNNSFKIGEEIEVILTSLLTSTQGLSFESPIVYRFWAETLGGTGGFTVVNTVVGQTTVSGLAAGDWDGDGDLDLASANTGNNRVDILEN